MTNSWLAIDTIDGRKLDVLLDGTDNGFPLVFHGGTPGPAVDFPQLAAAAASVGLRLITYSRPGYATSTPHEGRSVADAAGDVVLILDHLGLDRFLTLGWSGGGPHALACAALLPERCVAAATLAGLAPYDAANLDWYTGMGKENIEEFGAAATSREAIEAYLASQIPRMLNISGEEVAMGGGDLVSDVDRQALTGDFSEVIAAMFRKAVSTGIAGWRDDDLAFVGPWGFDVSAIAVPVSLWQGAHDRMVPFAHGKWLAANVSDGRVHLYEDEGHISLLQQLSRIVDDLHSYGE